VEKLPRALAKQLSKNVEVYGLITSWRNSPLIDLCGGSCKQDKQWFRLDFT
jgi:hypothetical protein